MRKIENYDEFMSLWNISHKNRYWGTRRITKEQEEDIIKRANAEDFKRYAMYMLDDNYHFIVFDTKWTINKTIYYDDETEPPKVTLEYFKKYNESNIEYYPLKKDLVMRPYFMINYNGNDQQVTIKRKSYITDYDNDIRWANAKNLFVRFVTDEEIEQYNQIVEELTRKYEERLEKYYKKYSKSINTHGYWANR